MSAIPVRHRCNEMALAARGPPSRAKVEPRRLEEGAVRLGTQRRRDGLAGRGYRTSSTMPRSDRSANTPTRAGGVATPRPHRPATSGGGVSSRPLLRWRYASAFDTPSRAGGGRVGRHGLHRFPIGTPPWARGPVWSSRLACSPSEAVPTRALQHPRSRTTVKGPLEGASIAPPPNEQYSTGWAGFSRNRRPPPGRAYIVTSAGQATRRWTQRAIQRVLLESPQWRQ